MATTKEITKAAWLELYSRGQIRDPLTRFMSGGEVRYYGRTTIEAADEPLGFIIVWCEE